MKFILLVSLLFSCRHLPKQDLELEKDFLSAEEVKEEFHAAESGMLMMDGEFDEADLERNSQLVPMDVFIPDRKKKKIEFKSVFRSFEGYPESVDLRKWDTKIKRQWNGTCTTFAGIAGIEQLMKAPSSIDLSERDSWNHYRRYSCASFIKALSRARVCDEKYWPQSREKPYSSCKNKRHIGMIKTEFIDNDKYLAIDALSKGHPVYVGMATPADMVKCYKVIRSQNKTAQGGHALLISGYKLDKSIAGGGYYILKNSWGTRCGDRGYQYLPFAYCDDFNRTWCRMWKLISVESGKASLPLPSPETPKRRLVCTGFWLFKKCEYKYD